MEECGSNGKLEEKRVNKALPWNPQEAVRDRGTTCANGCQGIFFAQVYKLGQGAQIKVSKKMRGKKIIKSLFGLNKKAQDDETLVRNNIPQSLSGVLVNYDEPQLQQIHLAKSFPRVFCLYYTQQSKTYFLFCTSVTWWQHGIMIEFLINYYTESGA